ncbi:MAG: sensor histidine kinase [Candidatus Binatia bacterium]
MKDQIAVSSTLPHRKPVSRWMTLAGTVALATLAALVLALFARRVLEYPSLSLDSLTRFDFDLYVVGSTVQELIIPVALIYLFSSTALFRRVVSGETTPRDLLKLFGVLAIIQLLAFSYYLGLAVFADIETTLGLLIVVAGGLLGGWRVGLGLGVVTVFIHGTMQFAFYPDADLLSIYRTEGLRGLFDLMLWVDVFFWYYVIDLGVSSAVWAGIVSGLYAELLGERRFAPLAALGLGVGIDLVAGYLTAITQENPADVTKLLIPSMLVSGLAMAAIALIVRGVQAEVARRKTEVAELALTQAELRALRAQINPHFLFNALNTIRYFVRTDAKTARRLLLNLSEVFQRALRSGEFVPLRDELSYVEAYLALEKARLDERLQVEWSVGAEAWLDHPVPTLILQPVVENAVIHGIARKPEGGTASITVELVDGDPSAGSGQVLLLRVEDDGPGIATARLEEVLGSGQASRVVSPSKGGAVIGLRNIDGRLRALYGEEYRLVVESEVGRGTRVEIRIPVVGD